MHLFNTDYFEDTLICVKVMTGASIPGETLEIKIIDNLQEFKQNARKTLLLLVKMEVWL